MAAAGSAASGAAASPISWRAALSAVLDRFVCGLLRGILPLTTALSARLELQRAEAGSEPRLVRSQAATQSMEAGESDDVATEALPAPEQAAAAAAAAPLVVQPQAGEVVAGGAQQEALDPTMVATHSYLGGEAALCTSLRGWGTPAVLFPRAVACFAPMLHLLAPHPKQRSMTWRGAPGCWRKGQCTACQCCRWTVSLCGARHDDLHSV